MIWDVLDELEGREKGESYRQLQKEFLRQGYHKKVKRRMKK